MATELVGIQLELMGADGVKRDLQNLDKLLDSLGGRKKFDAGFNEAKNQVVQYRGELEKLKREQAKLEKNSDEWNEKASEIENVKNKLRDAQQAVREFGRASQQAGKTFMQTFNSISSKVAHIGSAMQSLGNALTRMTSPFSRLTTGLLYGAGYKALNLLTEGLSGSFTRADTMNKYARLMKEYETANYTAIQSRQDLDDSIQGLPIALDDAISLAQRYTLSLGDMERGTQLAIATNNAFLASMATETQRYQGMLQLQDLMNGKDLTSREWMSLGASMGKAINEVGIKLGYSKDQLGEFRQELYAGNIATKDFLDALIAVGTGKGSLVNLAKVSAQTWEGLFSNIRIAVTRAGANIIETLNETFKDATGRTLLQQLLGIDAEGKKLGDGIRDWIDGISKSVQDWIKANPDKILEFFNELKSIDWKGLIKGFAEGMMWFARMMGAFAKWASNKDLEKIGRWLPKINLFGKGLTILGGFLKGTRHIWALLGAGAIKLGGGKLAKMGIFGKIASIFGKKKDIVTAGETAKEVPTVASTFRNAFKALEGLIKAAGAVLIVGTTGMIAFKEVKEMLKDLRDIGDIIETMDLLDLANAGEIGVGITVLAGALDAIGTAMGKGGIINEAIGALAVVLAGGTITALTWEAKTAFNQIKETITSFQEIANELSGFQAPEIDTSAILKTAHQIAVIYGVLSGQGGQNRSALGTAGRIFGFIRNPLGALAGSVAGGTKKAIDATTTANQYAGILGAIKSFKAIAKEINGLSNITINEGAVDKAQEVADAVNQLIGKMSTWTNKISGPKNLLANTKNFANAFIQLRRMAYHINALSGTAVNTDGFSAFVEQLKTALTELQALSGMLTLDITVKLAPGFKTSVNNTVKQIKKGNKDIRDALDDMPSTLTKQLTVNLTARVNVAQAVSAINSGTSLVRNIAQNAVAKYSATGGMIYRAKGGGVPYFKRRGTDTVPAMLTPGEYVHNKRAVSTFGIDFMRKVNNLDVKGAMNELMHRAGGMANINRGVSITNNNYNNQKVTINNSNNAGAGFTFKSASRFVGAF